MSVPANKRHIITLIAVLALLAGCHRNRFVAANFRSNDALFQASLAQLKEHKWDNAVNGFQRLTTQLPARDPLLPQAYYYLGEAHTGRREYILAAQAYSRIPESFPEDTLAAVATFDAGMSYSKLWRKPSLDSDYGQTALATLQSFLAAYPDSPLVDRARAEIDKLDEWFAIKGYDAGMFYLKRKAYDSAIIYFHDVATGYPGTEHARMALLRLVEAYGKIGYKEEIAETCSTLREKYASNAEVKEACASVPAPLHADSTVVPSAQLSQPTAHAPRP
ncbi:MAG TPA: outer membrane protein assembly factor BamD [Gemmatimonadaceae bacterium]|jgi:outer membrane assembly lipoprotein YfiO